MAYSVTLYKNSGYNVINIPDTPARLAADATLQTLPSINILQNRRLNQVLVACENADAEQADYIKIGNMYYAITDFKMQSTTTCLFQIVEKPLLSVGGVSKSTGGAEANFDILDGITSRCTVKDDSWGAYTSEDPLTAPQEPLQLQTEWLGETTGRNFENIGGDPIFVETTVNLPLQAAGPEGCFATVYKDEETQETVTVPETVGLPYVEGVGPQKTDFSFAGATKSNGTAVNIKNDLYTSDDTTISAGMTVQAGMNAIRSLGQESGSIINQWTIPTKFIESISVRHPGALSHIEVIDNEETTVYDGTDQVVTTITGRESILASNISPDYAAVKNKRVLYGDYNKYGMITCAGNSAEFKPEDLGGESAPSVSYKVDPRPKGKPYYRFTTINGSTEFWRNALAGSEWENVPLIYQGASGSALTRLNFDNERAIKSLQKQQYDDNYLLRQAQNVAGFADSAVGAVTGGMTGTALNRQAGSLTNSQQAQFSGAMSQMDTGVGGMFSSLVNIGATAVQQQQYGQIYAAQKANELSSLYQSTTVYAPTVNFPYNADTLRDIEGNGVLIYKYHMSTNDTKRVDKLLTMYGYKTAEPLTLENFQRRQKFDYVACSNVTVTGDYPKWLLDDIADELKNGIRIWHTKPDSAAYDNNPVRS